MQSMTIETRVTQDHLLRLPDELPANSRVRILIEIIDGKAADPRFEPRTALGQRLQSLRQQHIANGGRLLDADELDAEMDQRRGGVMDD